MVRVAVQNGSVTADRTTGRLLVSTPQLDDGLFHRSVILMLQHDDNGAQGVVLNKPLGAEVDSVLPGWGEHIASPQTLFQGGPVQLDSALGLVTVQDDDDLPPGAQALPAGARNYVTPAGHEKLRAELDENIADARMLLMREKKLTADDEETRGEEFAKEWRQKVIWVIRDNEMRKQTQQKAAMREEGRAQRKEDEEIKERKRKREQDEAWEKTRDTRINSWREFAQGKKPEAADGTKKKKKKVKALG